VVASREDQAKSARPKVGGNNSALRSALDWLPPGLKGACVFHSLASGEALFQQGDPANAIFEVESGRLRLLRQTIEGHTVVIHTARTGELFAEAALFSKSYHCNAAAAVPSRVRAYPKRKILTAIRSDPKLAEQLMAVLAHQLQAVRSTLEQRNIRSARQRILHHLALAAGPDGRTIRITGTLMDLASDIGLTHEVLYRTLAALTRGGVITRSPTAIVLQTLPPI
jgi:CRP/FNR family transcriptional regulator, dissimilatory nitrate respiration regulator